MHVIQHDPLQGLVFISSALRIWSGGVKLSRHEDLAEVEDRLPPRKMVTDGRKMLVDPTALAPFQAIRKRLERLLSREGFKLEGSAAYAVKADEVDSILDAVSELQREFEEQVPLFLAELESHYDRQASAFPEWADQLYKGRLSHASVKARLKFDVGIYKISHPDPTNANSALSKQYANVVNSATPSMLKDIARKASDVLSGAVGSKLVCTQTHHAQVRKLVERLDAFSFLDARVGPVVVGLKDMLAGIPATGPLSIGNTAVLRVISEQLAAPDTLLRGYEEVDQAPAVDVPATTPVLGPTQVYVGV